MRYLLSSCIFLTLVFGSCTSFPVKPTPGEQVDVFIPSGDSYLVGTITYPEDLSTPVPAVLLLPGFTGERDELPVTNTFSSQEGGAPLGMWEMTALALAQEGFASLRIDYRNSGKSPGKWEDITVTEELEDALASLKWLSKNPALDKNRLAVCGLSQGGTLASLMSTNPLVHTVVLWSAASDFSWLPLAIPQETISRIQSEGILSFSLPWGEEITMKKAYFDSVEGLDPLANIAQFSGPLLSLAGTQDTLVAPQPEVAQRFLEAHSEGPESLVVLEADHTFNNFTGPDGMEQAIRVTLEWLNQHLK